MALQLEMRGQSTATLFFHQVVADHLGLNLTDHKCLDAIVQSGAMTPGEIARQTHLTTGAVTGIIDRLEREGLVRREHDREDRRRVIVRPVVDEAECRCAPLFASMQRAFTDLCSEYSDEQLLLLIDFSRRAQTTLRDEADKLRDGDALSESAAAP